MSLFHSFRTLLISGKSKRSRSLSIFAIFMVFLVTLALPVVAGGARVQSGPIAQAQPVLRVYTYDSFGGEIMDAMAEIFLNRYNAIIEFEQPGDSGAVFTRLNLERNNPRADVFVGLDQTYLHRILGDNLTIAFRPANFSPVIPEVVVDDQFRVTPFDFGFITLNYDSQGFGPDGPPRTWQGLVDPANSGQMNRSIIMLNPATSSPGRNFLLLTIARFGEDGFLDFWRQLRPNILTVTGGWSEGYGLYSQGEAPMVVSYDTSPAYHRIFEGTDRFRSLPIDGEGYMQVEVAGIVRGTQQLELAQRFIDLLVSPEIQGLIALNQFMYPAQAGVELPEGFQNPGARVTRPVRLDSQLVADNFDRWLAQWEEVMR
jgi:thiamine transport system substrate-binding protein